MIQKPITAAIGGLLVAGCVSPVSTVIDLTPPAVPRRPDQRYVISVRVVSASVTDVFLLRPGTRARMSPAAVPGVREHTVTITGDPAGFAYVLEVHARGKVSRTQPHSVQVVSGQVR